MIEFIAPAAYSILQRAAAGSGAEDRTATEVLVSGSTSLAGFEAAIITLTGERRVLTPWQAVKPDGRGAFAVTFAVEAGGWYGVAVTVGDQQYCHGPFGIGDVFIVAGQSYLGNYHDARLPITDRDQRVAAYDPQGNFWRIAFDPQPSFDAPQDAREYWQHCRKMHAQTGYLQYYWGGSIWPAVGDGLVAATDVPVGFLNVAFGGTELALWQPANGPLFPALTGALATVPKHSAVLWHQGESDIAGDTDPEVWYNFFVTLKTTFDRHAGRVTPWIVAKATRHPTLYDKPELEAAYRKVVDRIWELDGVIPGPDADRLDQSCRSTMGYSCHLTRTGQETYAAMWCEAILGSSVIRRAGRDT